MQTIFGRFSQISIAAALLATSASLQAQNFPITTGQRATASQVAQTGVPLADLAPNAPDEYTIKRGDTLWAISGVFLKTPWRWPELWGMNLEDIRNPHRIYPGQQLYLDKSSGRAILRTRQQAGGGAPGTVRVSPRTRYESLADAAIPTLSPQAIEPFLSEALIVDDAAFALAPRIVAAQEGRVLLSRGDRAYARGAYSSKEGGKPLSDASGEPVSYRVFRNATPLKDPTTGEILGYEAVFLGKADLVRGESTVTVKDKDGKDSTELVPATLDILIAKEEMRVGDRLAPEPPRELLSYVPRAPATQIEGQIVSIYGSAVLYAAGNQVVVVNRGARDGLERGHVMAIQRSGERLTDRTDSARTQMRLPNERNGLMMVFRTFEKLSYALILEVTEGVKVGDRFVNPN
ncbi:MAG: LysM domain-containing protein [Polaromonas sp.]|uniref:LysM peptidoglycan-binding domain-containing protein n=1 Tax=Polaromonas sp. TaxID=1869339 RepID=UPI00273031F7|nr:LysM domain-containing protein [Polaromonas sp.]MDP1741189.1 LysM domain-containing protein [Polaromonas sp.]MDP1954012.1 LysM domain-containing protein [Polaromonas sp.]MDP3354475.1 LysM domain-containing protein [Polaromonas sp.]MDP3752787.1 LysM domain-containing protein [Polaromonas sp.]